MSKDMKQIDATKIRIISIRLLNGNITSTEAAIRNNNVPLECETQLNAKNSVNTIKKEFVTLLTVHLNAVDSERQQVGITGEYSFEIRIQVDNLEEYIVPGEGQIIVIQQLMTGTLMSIAYSTARGIVLMRTLGTVLEGVILPVVNPLQIPGVSSQK